MTLANLLGDIQSGATLGVVWAIMALGLYITYRVLNYADMTVDGSLTLGGAISAVYVASGMNPLQAILLATLGGMIAGTVTGILHTKFKIPDLLAGILTQFGLYSINLRIMGKANFGLLNETTLFTQIKAMGVPSKWAGLFVGLVIGNGLVAMAGAILAQYQGYADINMGVGSIVIGLAAIMIGEVLFSKRSYVHRLVGVVIGSIVYRIIIAFVLRISLSANPIIKITADDMKLITAIIVVIALVAPNLKDAAAKSAVKED